MWAVHYTGQKSATTRGGGGARRFWAQDLQAILTQLALFYPPVFGYIFAEYLLFRYL